MDRSIATVWSRVEIRSIPSQLRWTPSDVVMKWFEADALSLRALQEIEADAMSALIDQTRWNGSGGRFCAILSVNGRQRLLFAAVQEDGQAFSVGMDGIPQRISKPKGPAAAPTH